MDSLMDSSRVTTWTSQSTAHEKARQRSARASMLQETASHRVRIKNRAARAATRVAWMRAMHAVPSHVTEEESDLCADL